MKELLVLVTLAISTPSVVDGDTIRSGGVSIRLINYDTPELGGRCTEEVRRAQLAKSELKALMPYLRFELRKCATENYGRLCAEGFLGSETLASVMIGKGLGAEYICSGAKCPRKKDWCRD